MSEPKNFSRYRWTVCALIFFATTVNYLDRQVIGILKPLLESDLGIGEKDYSHIIMAFQLCYGLAMVIAGRLIDKFGTKLGYGISVYLWSIAAIGHALAKGVLGFGFWRGLLGISESGNFPAANKAIAEWFPKKERALAIGIFNSGTNVGAIVAPLAIPAIVAAWGWQAAFIITGAFGFVWIIFWFIFYEVPESREEYQPVSLLTLTVMLTKKRKQRKKYHGCNFLNTGKHGFFSLVKALPIPSGGFTCSGSPGGSLLSEEQVLTSKHSDCH